jgi:hypothetical protein
MRDDIILHLEGENKFMKDQTLSLNQKVRELKLKHKAYKVKKRY